MLTKTQAKILAFIRRYSAENGYPPTRPEIAQHMGYRSSNAASEACRAIETKGYITIKPGIPRGIKITSRART